MFYTSLIQVMNVDGDNGLIATGKKNRLAFFKVHKVGEGGSVRMFESVVHPRHFIRLKETHVDILVSMLLISILRTMSVNVCVSKYFQRIQFSFAG